MPDDGDASGQPAPAPEPRRAQPDKAEVAAVLDEIGTLLELDGGNPFEAEAENVSSDDVLSRLLDAVKAP